MLGLRAWAVLVRLTASDPCPDDPSEAVVQLTNSECTCCASLEDFVQDKDLAYVLFYSPQGRLNRDIGAKFEQVAHDWRHTRISFAKIDVDRDRDMAAKWVEPGMVPTNVMYKFGRPVEVKPSDFEYIRDKYHGSAEGQKWMLSKYLQDSAEKADQRSNIFYADPLVSKKKLKKFKKKHEVAVIGFFGKETDLATRVWHEAVWTVHKRSDAEYLGVAFAEVVDNAAISEKEGATVPSVRVYLDGRLVDDDESIQGTYAPTTVWELQPLTEFIEGFLPVSEETGELDKQEL